jgi:hypothetical protein
MLDWLRNWFNDMFQATLCALKQAFCWVVDQIFNAIYFVVTGIFGLLPDTLKDDIVWSYIQDIASFANAWFPLAEAITLASGSAFLMVGLIGTRLLLKLIPWIG